MSSSTSTYPSSHQSCNHHTVVHVDEFFPLSFSFFFLPPPLHPPSLSSLPAPPPLNITTRAACLISVYSLALAGALTLIPNDYFLKYPVCSNVIIGELLPSLLVCDNLLHSRFLFLMSIRIVELCLFF